MSESENLHRLEVEGREVLLLGTAHVSRGSVDEVIALIEKEQPDTVCVELCQSRYEALSKPDAWKDMDIFQVVRTGKTFLLLANLILAAFQRKLGDQLGIKPGAEMIVAMEEAKKIDAEIVLADRDIQTTLRKAWRSLPFREKVTVMGQLTMSVFDSEEISEEEIEKLKEQDVLSEAMDAFAENSPTIKRVLIDERDQYLAEKIRTSPGKKIVAVVGAGHVPGIKLELEKEHDLDKLNSMPPPSNWLNIIKYGLPTLIIGLIIYGFTTADGEFSWEIAKRWVLFNGTLSALGAALAWGHPITVLSAFVAAPITSLNPAVAAGWVAGLVEASVHKPQVRDFEKLTSDITKVSGFWKNKITRILLVVALANVGSALGTFLGASSIVSLLSS